MRSFLKNISWFFLPFVLIGLALELSVHFSENSFITKAKYLEENKDIDLLVLRSSHNQGINIKYLDIKAGNLAYGMQDYQLDSALFFSKINGLKNLKMLILEYDYISLFKTNSKDYYRYGWYAIYHGIEINRLSLLNKTMLYSTSPEFFNNHLIKKLSGDKKKEAVDEFAKLIYDKKLIDKKSANRMNKMKWAISKDNFGLNAKRLETMINYCQNNDILVVLISNPVYEKYRNGYDPELDKIRKNHLLKLKQRHQQVVHLNFEETNDFGITDYKDEDHLNQNALKAYTHIINQSIDSSKIYHSLY